MSDWPIIGHQWAVALLSQAIESGQLSHAYLLTGPDGLGKTTLATTFAQALLCGGYPSSCDECHACARIAANVHPDVWLVEPRDGVLRVDQVRDVTREASRRPLEASHRVFILSHMEQAHPAAANALLKTLEEPPAHVVLILTAPSEDALLPTLVSRCQVLHLRPVPEDELVTALREQWGVDEERALLLARLSGGRPGWALRVQEDEGFWALRKQALELVTTFAQNPSRWLRLQESERWSKQDADARLDFLHLLQIIYRDMLVTLEGQTDALRNVDQREHLTSLASRLGRQRVQKALATLIQTQRHLQTNVNVRLALDVLFLHM